MKGVHHHHVTKSPCTNAISIPSIPPCQIDFRNAHYTILVNHPSIVNAPERLADEIVDGTNEASKTQQ